VAPPPFRVTDRHEALTHDVGDAQVVLDALPVEFPAPDIERRVERVLRKVAGRATVRRDEAADAYAMAFLDRFGIGVRVPLLRVVDRAFGIGFVNEDPATTATAPTRVDVEKRLVLEWVGRRAATEGTRSVELDRADLDRLLQRERRPFREFDAMYEIDGEDGDTAWVTRIGRTALAGATAGRFHRAVPEEVFLGAADEQNADGAAVKPATVWFLPRWSTSLDVMDMPSPVPLRIEVDFRSGDDSARGLDDLDVAHDGERLILLDRCDDRPIVVRNHSMFNVGQLASPLVRTLLTLGRETLSEWLVFDWGPLDGWDFLPGIVHDGVGLSRPLWRLPSAVLDRARPESEREAAFLRWKADRGESGHLEFGDGDQTLITDVDDPDAWSLIAAVLTPDNPLAFGAVARSEGDPAVEYVQRIRPGGEAHRSTRPTGRLRPLALTDTGADLEWISLELALGVGLPEPRHWSALLRLAAEHDVTDWHHLYFNDPDHHLRLRFRSPDPTRRAALRAALEDAAFRMARDTFRRVSFTPYFPEWERYGGRANAELIWRLFTESSEAVIASSTVGGWGPGGADHLARVVAVAVDQVQALVGSDWREHIDQGLAHIRADRRSHHRRAEALRILRERVPDAPSTSGDYRDGPGLAPVRGVINSVLHMHSNRAFPGDRDEEIVLLSTLRSLARLPAVVA
ncbi:MAG: thiopeptide-type bacteriocin biosynthesis protein, partial [Curtobacterium sp.]